MADCVKFQEEMQDYFDNTLDNKAQDALWAHLTDCADCALLFDAYEEVQQQLNTAFAPVPVNFTEDVMSKIQGTPVLQVVKPKRVRQRFFAAAALFFLVFGVGFWALGGGGFLEEQQTVPDALLAAPIVPNVEQRVFEYNWGTVETEDPVPPVTVQAEPASIEPSDFIADEIFTDDERIELAGIDMVQRGNDSTSFDPTLFIQYIRDEPWSWEAFSTHLLRAGYHYYFSQEVEGVFFVPDPYNLGSYFYGFLSENEENEAIIQVLGYHLIGEDFSRRVELRLDETGVFQYYYDVPVLLHYGVLAENLRSLLEFLIRGNITISWQ